MTELTAVTSNIYRLVIPFLDIYTTVFIVTTDSGAVLIDTATYPEDIDNYVVPALKKLNISAEKLLYTVITHNHRDHAGGLERFVQLFPNAFVAAGSTGCQARIPGRTVQVLEDGQSLLGPLKAVALPGHTADFIGILDTRTNTLISGDGLQLYGIYGSGKWGANISLIPEHLALGRRLKQIDIETILASHNYHPCDWRADGKEAVCRYIDECADALFALKEYADRYPEPDAQALADQYNAQSGLPTVGAHVFKALRAAVENGSITG